MDLKKYLILAWLEIYRNETCFRKDWIGDAEGVHRFNLSLSLIQTHFKWAVAWKLPLFTSKRKGMIFNFSFFHSNLSNAFWELNCLSWDSSSDVCLQQQCGPEPSALKSSLSLLLKLKQCHSFVLFCYVHSKIYKPPALLPKQVSLETPVTTCNGHQTERFVIDNFLQVTHIFGFALPVKISAEFCICNSSQFYHKLIIFTFWRDCLKTFH